MASQRVALNIAANAAQFVQPTDFNAHVKPCLAELTQRMNLTDKRAVESVVTLFSRLADNLRGHSSKLIELASGSLLADVQQLVSVPHRSSHLNI